MKSVRDIDDKMEQPSILLRLNTFAFRRVADLCTLSATSCIRELRQKLLRYAERQWITKSTVGPQRLSVRDNPSRTNNVLESFHSALRSRVKVAHPNVFAFLAHLQRATLDSQADVRCASRGMAIRRAKKKANVVSDKRIKTCLQRYDTNGYTRLQFLQAVSHSISSYTDDMCDVADDNSSDDDAASDVDRGEVQQSDTPSTSATTDTPVSASVDNCEVCLVAPMDPRIALVPCGHRRFCDPYAEEVHNRGLCCPMC